MRNIVIIFIIILSYTNCTKTNVSDDTIQSSNASLELSQVNINNNYNNEIIINTFFDEEMFFDDTMKSIYDNLLNNISDFIASDLNVNFKYESLRILFESLHLTENDILNGYKVLENGLYQGHDGYMNYYVIHIGYYILNIISFDEIIIDDIIKDNNSEIILSAVEIELSNENYVHLFPYSTKNEYLLDKNFGCIVQIKDNYIHYYAGDEWGPGINFYLIFNEREILRSIKMSFYVG